MSNLEFKDHFSKKSENYAAYRPSYPYNLVQQLATLSPSLECALDCGCGTGQLSVLLAESFQKVIATDASAAQIEKAQQQKGISYKIALAESSGLADASVDLITVAQAAHWLNLDLFYEEVQRIAKPNAILALISYGVLHLEGSINIAIQDFYTQTIGTYWPPERQHVENGYKDLPFPFPEIHIPTINMHAYWTLDELIGYFNTWSAVKKAQDVLGFNPTEPLKHSLLTLWNEPQQPKKITWPLSLRIGKLNTE